MKAKALKKLIALEAAEQTAQKALDMEVWDVRSYRMRELCLQAIASNSDCMFCLDPEHGSDPGLVAAFVLNIASGAGVAKGDLLAALLAEAAVAAEVIAL